MFYGEIFFKNLLKGNTVKIRNGPAIVSGEQNFIIMPLPEIKSVGKAKSSIDPQVKRPAIKFISRG